MKFLEKAEESFLEVTYILALSGLIYSLYSFYLFVTGGSFYYAISGTIGYMFMFMIIDRNVYYKRVQSFVDLVIEENLPIRYDSHTSYVYDNKFIINKNENYEEISDYKSLEDSDTTVMREYMKD